MWEKVGVEKNASDLRSAHDDIERIRLKLLPGMKIRNTGKSVNYEWLDAIDVINMIDVCELVIHSSLERKESRGPFIRQDFPLTDNDNWLAANVLKKSGNGLRFERRPYDLPLFAPGFSRKDNLEVAW
jgi:succinate dehydrogenase/fumarate reductase flavoprotein subunit